MIEVRDLHQSLGGQQVLGGVDFTVDEGDIVALLGASGAGKSVMLKTLVGLLAPDSGSVSINGSDVHEVSGAGLEKLRDSVGMLFQGGALFDSMTVGENLAFPLREKTDLAASEIDSRVEKQLSRVGLESAADKYPAELSGGMQKRAALARTLVRNPEIIFFDEPTTGLDPMIGNSILRLIKELHDEFNFTAVLVTHNFQKVFPIVHKVAMIHNGQLVAKTSPDEFMDLQNPAVRNFVDEALKGPLEAVNHDA